MASLGQAKTLGGVGSILVLLTIVPNFGFILGIIGWILVLIAVKNVADTFSDNKIFSDMLIAAVLVIVGTIAVGVIVAVAVFQFIGVSSSLTFTPGSPPPTGFFALLGTILIGLAIGWVCYLVASIFIKRSYDSIALRTNVGTFRTTGLLLLIGAVTTIIFVGFIIVLIAIILQIVAFFSIPEQITTQPPAQTWTPPPSPPPQTM